MKNAVVLLGFVALVTILNSEGIVGQESPQAQKKIDAEAAKKFIGKWAGIMKSPVCDDFPVELNIKEFKYGKWCADLKHVAPVNAEGKMLGIKIDGKSMVVAQTVFRGREGCLDGMNVLTLIDDNTMERVWYDPETGEPRDKGTLKRQLK